MHVARVAKRLNLLTRKQIDWQAAIEHRRPHVRHRRAALAEKNHERLIRAFALVHATAADTRLLILGTGPLHERLTAVIGELGLHGAVTLAGYQDNPYAIVAGPTASCFPATTRVSRSRCSRRWCSAGRSSRPRRLGARGVHVGTGLVVERDTDALAGGDGRVPAGRGRRIRRSTTSPTTPAAMEEVYRAIRTG